MGDDIEASESAGLIARQHVTSTGTPLLSANRSSVYAANAVRFVINFIFLSTPKNTCMPTRRHTIIITHITFTSP